MTAHHVAHQGEQVEVDVCDGCGSVFLDYFDGEPGAVARSLETAGRFKPGVAVSPTKGCPECRADLVLTPYLDEGGPDIYRCGRCGGAFLLPVQLGAIADYRPAKKDRRGKLEQLVDAVVDSFFEAPGLTHERRDTSCGDSRERTLRHADARRRAIAIETVFDTTNRRGPTRKARCPGWGTDLISRHCGFLTRTCFQFQSGTSSPTRESASLRDAPNSPAKSCAASRRSPTRKRCRWFESSPITASDL